MRWRKLGKIFDPTDHHLPDGCTHFAQSPQALVFDDYVRIYFSTREHDPIKNKYLSRVAYVDMRKDLSAILRVSDKTVIDLGTLGCFDEHGIFPMNVLRHEGRIYGYTCGWNRRVSVSVDTAIGLAISDDDGLSFHRVGPGPVLGPSLREPFLVGDPFVKHHNGVFHMWYIFGTKWHRFVPGHPPDRVYKIGYATSRDGLEWDGADGRQLIADRLHIDECQALPTVLQINGIWHMLFCYREPSDFRSNSARGYRIGHAWSADGLNWRRDDQSAGIDLTPGEWDSDMMCYPHLFECDGNVYLLYNGNAFGRYGFGAAILQ